jgi:hypothetical protein
VKKNIFMVYIKSFFIFLFGICVFPVSNAQRTIPVADSKNLKNGFGPNRTVVRLDPLTRLPLGNVPFDRTFILRVYFNKGEEEEITSFYLYNKKRNEITKLDYYLISAGDVTKYDKTDDFLSTFTAAVDLVVPALYPNCNYELKYSTLNQVVRKHYFDVFKLFYDNKIAQGQQLQLEYKQKSKDNGVPTAGLTLQYYNDNNLKKIYDSYTGDTSKANKDIIKVMVNNNTLNVAGIGTVLDFFNPWSDTFAPLSEIVTYVYTIQSSSKARIVADGGVIYAGWQSGFNVIVPYVGINISLRPMDTDIPFRTLVRNKRIKCYQRFTFNLGLTLNSIAKDNYRANLFGNNNLMVGLGFKFSHAINLNLGGLLYNNVDPNPLIAKKTIGVAPYTGVSINLLIKDALGDIAKVFGYAK